MLHVVSLDLMQASARHHADGRPKDPFATHRRDIIIARRLARRQAWGAALRRFGLFLRRSPETLAACVPPAPECDARAAVGKA